MRNPLLIAAAVLLIGGSASGLINPTLQPNDLFERYLVVLSARVKSVADDGRGAVLAVETVYKGKLDRKGIDLQTEDEGPEALLANWQKGDRVVALVGKPDERHAAEMLFYFGTRMNWQQGRVQQDGSWLWVESDLGPEAPGFGLWGTWNGDVQRLAEMCRDFADGRYYFPVQSFAVFDPPLELARFEPGALKGVAAHDLDGDGRIDLVAASRDGVKAFRQRRDGSFEDVTAAWGLADAEAGSVSVASVRGDGRQDLLLDAKVCLRTGSGFAAGAPVAPGLAGRPVLSAGFVDADGDGLPDVLVSVREGGLRLFHNKGVGQFEDVAAGKNLAGEDAGAGLSGYVAPGDWNGDGRLDLYYAADFGFLLLQGEDGRFERQEIELWPSFESDAGPGRTGAGRFVTCWRPDRYDILVGAEAAFLDLIRRGNARIEDATHAGNEFADGAFRLLGGLAEDFNADGTVDILGVTASTKQGNVFLMNRGYGSYMRCEKYRRDLLPGAMGDRGAMGGVAVDIDADGDCDVVLASADGVLRLCRNRTWDSRRFTVTRSTKLQDRVLAGTGLVHVRVLGRQGVIGGEVVLADAKRQIVARRWIGAEMFTGCRGADTCNLAVRDAGPHTLTVRYSDGGAIRREINILPGKVVRAVLDRDADD